MKKEMENNLRSIIYQQFIQVVNLEQTIMQFTAKTWGEIIAKLLTKCNFFGKDKPGNDFSVRLMNPGSILIIPLITMFDGQYRIQNSFAFDLNQKSILVIELSDIADVLVMVCQMALNLEELEQQILKAEIKPKSLIVEDEKRVVITEG